MVSQGSVATIRRQIPAAPRVAVLLNGNARRVTRKLVKRFSEYMSKDDIFYTETLEQAEQSCQTIYDRQYDLVLTGGGDGTLLNCVTQLHERHKQDGKGRQLPALGVLHLGTGNAMASVLGASQEAVSDLAYTLNSKGLPIRKHKWVSVNGQITPFAGIGYDSLIINTYKKWKDALANTPLSWLGHGGLGYFFSIAFGAIPASLLRKRTNVKIINQSDKSAYLLGSDGQYVKEFAPGEVMYSGQVTFVGASTIPCFGFHFKMFPFATSGQQMQLRVTSISSIETVLNLPAIWKGTYRSPKVFDFHAEKVKVQCLDAEPLQIGGDAAGYTNEVEFSLSEQTTPVLSLAAAKRRPLLSSPSYHSPRHAS